LFLSTSEEDSLGVYYRKFRKSGNRIWWLTYTANGRQVFESSHSTSKRFAEKLLAIRKAEIAENRWSLPASNPPHLKEWTSQFLRSISHPNTKKRYELSAAQSTNFFGEHANLSELSVKRLEEFKRHRSESGVKPATINRDLALLRQLLKRAERERYIARTPFGTGNLFLEEKKGRRQPHIMTYDEETKLLAVSGPLLKALVILLVETGLRVGKEALPLKWTDIDLSNGTLCVRESKTLAGRRMVPLSEYCKAELFRWRALTGPEYSEYVFFNDRSPSAHLLKLPKTWKRALKNSKIEYFPIGNLRHTFATRMQEAGTAPVTLAQMMGHSSTGIIQTYAKVLDEYRRHAVEKLDAHRQVQTLTTATNSQPN
jgi:integrase